MYRECINIQSSYYQFGIELGLPLREMDAIKKAFHQDITQAFTEVLSIWLRHRYDVKRYGPPTWRRLVEAVDSSTGGSNHALAKKIAGNHHSIDTTHHALADIITDCPTASATVEKNDSANENTHAIPTAIAAHNPEGMYSNK